MDAFPKNEETAAMAVSEKVESIRETLKEIMAIADEFELRVEVLREFGDYLTYYGRPYIRQDQEYIRSDDGGWYHSTC
jgi:hypothetical protein